MTVITAMPTHLATAADFQWPTFCSTLSNSCWNSSLCSEMASYKKCRYSNMTKMFLKSLHNDSHVARA